MYEYKCSLERVVDGTTIDAELDLGFNICVKQRIRLYGIETATLQTNDPLVKEQAHVARNRLLELLPKEFIVKTVLNKRGKFGRVLGYIYIEDAEGNRKCINDILVAEGTATRYEVNKEQL